MNNPHLPVLREKAARLPLSSGVYIMRNKDRDIIYIGKAKILRNRVSSYFRNVEKHLPKVFKMVEHVQDFDYIVTGSEFEALILECSMIKQHTPRYNILLKDDKGYSYIKIENSPYPRITEVKQKEEDGAVYIGPYNSSFVVKQTVEQTNKAFLMPTCTRRFPQEIRKGRPCLNLHIKQCMGVCTGRVSPEEYQEILKQAISFIRGGCTSAIAELEQAMAEAAENMQFEKAALYRDRLRAIQKINERQSLVETGAANQDVIAFVKSTGNTCATVLKFREQRLIDKEDFLIGETDDLVQTRQEFLLTYYNKYRDLPPQVTLDGALEDPEIVSRYLSQLAQRKVTLLFPQKGENRRLVDMALSNGAEKLSQTYKKSGKEVEALDGLGKLLGLKNPPAYIESYDISNFGDQVVVAGMVVFQNGKPLKSAYKRFQIKTLDGRDDYGSMREVISRRFTHYLEEKDTDSSFGRLPDLILLDGGIGHVHVVQEVLDSMGISVPIFGMVKDSKHKTRAITSQGGEIAIMANRSTFTFVSAIQEEVHRFAIAYSRQKHSKQSFASQLTQVEGIGEKKAAEILKHFKTQKALYAADRAALEQVSGISPILAERLYTHLHPTP